MVEEEVTEEQLKEFGKTRYPKFVDNLELIRACYEREKGITPTQKLYIKKKISEIKEGEFVSIEGLVARKERESKYVGCKICRKKRKDLTAPCINCGGTEFTEFIWQNFLIGDKTAVVIAEILLPKISIAPVEGKVYEFKGKVSMYKNNYQILVDVVVEPKVTSDLKRAVNEAMDLFDVYDGVVEKQTFQEWFARQNFNVAYEEVIGYLNIQEKENKIMLVKKEGEEKK